MMPLRLLLILVLLPSACVGEMADEHSPPPILPPAIPVPDGQPVGSADAGSDTDDTDTGELSRSPATLPQDQPPDASDEQDAAPSSSSGCPSAEELAGTYNGNFEGEITYGPTLVSGNWSFSLTAGTLTIASGTMSGSGGGSSISAGLSGTLACPDISGSFVGGSVAGYSFGGSFSGTFEDGFFLGRWSGSAMGYSGSGTWKAWKQ